MKEIITLRSMYDGNETVAANTRKTVSNADAIKMVEELKTAVYVDPEQVDQERAAAEKQAKIERAIATLKEVEATPEEVLSLLGASPQESPATPDALTKNNGTDETAESNDSAQAGNEANPDDPAAESKAAGSELEKKTDGPAEERITKEEKGAGARKKKGTAAPKTDVA